MLTDQCNIKPQDDIFKSFGKETQWIKIVTLNTLKKESNQDDS